MIDGGVLWGADWRTYFVEGVYPSVYYGGVTPWNLSWVFLHGVNHAQGEIENYKTEVIQIFANTVRLEISPCNLPHDT